ncbi:MAG: hypothetical protein WC143_03325 [Eubacteriales bacterium]
METCVCQEKRLKKEYKDPSGLPVMYINLTVPVTKGRVSFVSNTKKLYSGVFDGFLSYCETKVYKKALKEIKNDGFNPRGGVLKYTVSYEDEQFFSTFIDAFVYNGKSRGKVARLSQVWSKDEGRLLNFYDFFSREDRETLISLFLSSSRENSQKGLWEYKNKVDSLIENNADFSKFYLVPNGFAFYFDAGVLSPSPLPAVFITSYKAVNM